MDFLKGVYKYTPLPLTPKEKTLLDPSASQWKRTITPGKSSGISPFMWVIMIIITILALIIFSVPGAIIIGILSPLYLIGAGIAFIKSLQKKQTKPEMLLTNTMKSWYYVF